jgi:hypothetical protein
MFVSVFQKKATTLNVLKISYMYPSRPASSVLSPCVCGYFQIISVDKFFCTTSLYSSVADLGVVRRGPLHPFFLSTPLFFFFFLRFKFLDIKKNIFCKFWYDVIAIYMYSTIWTPFWKTLDPPLQLSFIVKPATLKLN